MFHQFIARNRNYFDVHTFFGQPINKRSFEDWKLCRHNYQYHHKDDNLLPDILEMTEMKDVPTQHYMKT